MAETPSVTNNAYTEEEIAIDSNYSVLPELEEDPLKIDDIIPEINKQPDAIRNWTGYILWSADRRKELLKTEQGLSSFEITKRLNVDWEKVSMEEKCRYRSKAIVLNTPTIRQSNRPKKPKEIIDISIIPSMPNKPSRTRSKQSNAVTKKKIWSVNDSIAGVQSKVTGYSLWFKERRVNILNQQPDISFGDLSRCLADMWKSTPLSEKNKYKRRAKRINETLFKPKDKASDNKELLPSPETKEDIKVSRRGRILLTPSKLADFHKEEQIVISKSSKKEKLKSSISIESFKNFRIIPKL